MRADRSATEPDEFADGLAMMVGGRGDEAVFWVHGYTLDASTWSPVWRELPGWRHIAPDLPEHGQSRAIRPGETLPNLAASLAATAHTRGARHLVGLSFGGLIALQMAIDHPHAFDTVTLSSPAIGGGPGDPASRRRHGELTRLYRERGAGPWMTELWMSSPPDIFRGAAANPQLWSALRAVVDRHRWAELADARLGGLTAQPRQMHDAVGIRADVLLLVGEHDIASFRRGAELLRAKIPRYARMYVADAGHLSLLEAPVALAPRLSAHLRGAPVR